MLKNGTHQPKMQALWDAERPDDWELIVLEECEAAATKDREIHWAAVYSDVLLNERQPGVRYSLSAEQRRKMSESRARYLETPGARESLSTRARAQHAQDNFGAHTWKEGPDFEKIADKYSRTPENKQRLRDHVAAQSSEEMSRRSYERKIFK